MTEETKETKSGLAYALREAKRFQKKRAESHRRSVEHRDNGDFRSAKIWQFMAALDHAAVEVITAALPRYG